MIWLVALLLSPYLGEEVPVRLVSDGTADTPVTWILDGDTVANTTDGAPARIQVTPGAHALWAITDADGPWRVLARPDPDPGGQVAYVPAWTAEAPADAPSGPAHSVQWTPWMLAAVATVLLWPRRPKDP